MVPHGSLNKHTWSLARVLTFIIALYRVASRFVHCYPVPAQGGFQTGLMELKAAKKADPSLLEKFAIYSRWAGGGGLHTRACTGFWRVSTSRQRPGFLACIVA